MDQTWQQIAKYVNPDMDFTSDPTEQQKAQDHEKVYDTTVIKASNLLADGIQGYSFARNQSWMRLGLEDIDELSEEETEWLSYAEKQMYSQSQRSNFYDEGRSFVKCCADFGTAIMTREDDVLRGMPSYKTQHLKNCSIDENAFGEVDVLFRDFWIDAYRAASLFGEKNLPKNIKEAYEKGNMKLWKFTQVILPVDRYDLDIDHPQYKEYYSVYWADIERDKPLLDGYYQLKPFFCWRWSRNLDGGVWGTNSPGIMHLPDIKQANSVRADLSRVHQLTARPPIKAMEGLNGRINLKPNGVTYIRAGEDFAPAQIIGRPDGMIDDLNRLQQSINSGYYTDFFLILSQNIERQKTATEVAGIQGEKAALMSAFYGRLTSEYLEPIVEDLFSIELMAGRIPRPPESLLQQNRNIRVDMVSPLAQAQKRYLMLGTSQQVIAEVAQLAQLKPDVLDNIDLDRYVTNIAEANGLDKRIIVDFADVERMRQARAQQQQAMIQQEQQLRALEVGAKAAGSLPPEMLQQAQAQQQGAM